MTTQTEALNQAKQKIESAMNCHPNAVPHLLGEAWDFINEALSSPNGETQPAVALEQKPVGRIASNVKRAFTYWDGFVFERSTMKNISNLIIDAAKNDDMQRVIELAEKQQDKFCDNNCVWTDHHPDCVRAEPEWYHVIDVHGCNRFYHKTEDCPYEFSTPLYTTPPQRTWAGLTDEEIEKVWRSVDYTKPWDVHRIDVAHAIETKLKEKNTWLQNQ